MRLHRFYVREKLEVGREVVIPDSDLTHQLKRVFRLKVGNVIVLFDGDGFEYVSQILSFEDNAITFRINEAKGSLELPKVKVCLYPSLIKKDNLEWVIQKCTELGVAEFHPVISERSEKKSFDMLRAEKIAIEAAEQSGWERIPKIYEPRDVREELKKAENPIILESDAPIRLGESGQGTVSIFVGPEGGWTDAERKFFADNKIPLISLGNQTLRAETASVAISTLVLAH